MNPVLGGQYRQGYYHNQHQHDPYNSNASNREAFTYEVWNNFFSSAGIPESVAHDYAVTFSQHRIKIDMLKEITKDILIDMGIKAMGDIIAILRHAKNLCTQDELKSIGSSVTKAPPNNHNKTTTRRPTYQPPSTSRQPTLQAPTSTTSRTSSGTPSLGGNKIQSRLNLSSGALVASTSNNGAGSSTSHQSSTSNKRTHPTSLSSSLNKRLRPASTDRPLHGNLPEKTLTVHYPPVSAIARAQQRISSSTAATTAPAIPKASDASLRVGSSSIRSRLGNTVNGGGARLDGINFTSRNNTQNLPREQRNVNNPRSSYTDSRNYNDRGFQTNQRSQYREGASRERDTRHYQTIKPKSTVFSRLGDSTR